ncbi:hypothetical protein C8Q78DRAFT_1010138 [Trametes maxima]|nr:hypothetical protein C8Q78DRAFT_1010138 [Trametes maxima]
MFHKAPPSSSPSKAQPSETHERMKDICPRKHRFASRGSILSSLDVWLSGFTPAVLRPWLLNTPMLPTLILGYCLLSVLVLTGYLYYGLWTSPSRSRSLSLDQSLLAEIPLDHLLSKLSPLHTSVDINVLSTTSRNPALCACLWTTDENVEHIEGWAAEWRGPISLLVTTTAKPSSKEYSVISTKLTAIQRKHPPLKNTFFPHILHLNSSFDIHPNALINLARLLAPSPRVVIFPGNLSETPPKTLYHALLHQQPTSSSAMTSTRKRRPAVLTDHARTSFPFAPLAPLVLARDDATWCTERFFADMSPSADWEECLWQVWLANFGDLEVRQVPGLAPDDVDVAEVLATVCSLSLLCVVLPVPLPAHPAHIG